MKKYIIVLIAMAILLLCLCIYGWIKQESDKKQATTLQKDRIDAGNTIFSYYGKEAESLSVNYICLFDYLFISSQMSAKPYFMGSTGILHLR